MQSSCNKYRCKRTNIFDAPSNVHLESAPAVTVSIAPARWGKEAVLAHRASSPASPCCWRCGQPFFVRTRRPKRLVCTFGAPAGGSQGAPAATRNVSEPLRAPRCDPLFPGVSRGGGVPPPLRWQPRRGPSVARQEAAVRGSAKVRPCIFPLSPSDVGLSASMLIVVAGCG